MVEATVERTIKGAKAGEKREVPGKKSAELMKRR